MGVTYEFSPSFKIIETTRINYFSPHHVLFSNTNHLIGVIGRHSAAIFFQIAEKSAVQISTVSEQRVHTKSKTALLTDSPDIVPYAKVLEQFFDIAYTTVITE